MYDQLPRADSQIQFAYALFEPLRIISGGQTGVDRAALDAAQETGISAGGWCPKNRRAEDGEIPSRYPLRELDSPEYIDRTVKNVLSSDATLILFKGEPLGGTAETVDACKQWERPFMIADPFEESSRQLVRHWLDRVRPETLNVAGPRESEVSGIQVIAKNWLVRLFTLNV